jgi:ParB family chromosome partitioning protein
MARLSEKFARHGKGEEIVAFDPFERDRTTYAEIPVEQIQPDPDQPRQDLGDLEELKASIRAHGILQPLIVTALEFQRYQLVAGERRYTAAREMGLRTVPALVRTVEEHRRLEVQLVENLHRKDLNPLEEARSYRRLLDEFGLTQEELGRRLGRSQPAINLTLKLLELPEAIQQAYSVPEQGGEGKKAARRVSKSVLQEIARLPSQEAQLSSWEQARRGELTVKQARQQKAGAGTTRPSRPAASVSFRYPIQTELALVTLVFAQAKASQEEIVAALEEALEGERRRLPGRR